MTDGLSSVPDDMDDEQWLRVIRSFDGAKDFRVASELATDISRALRLADEGHKIVLPALRNLYEQEPVHTAGLMWDTVESFVTQRQLSSLPVQIYVQEDSGGESIPVVRWRLRQQVCLAFTPLSYPLPSYPPRAAYHLCFLRVSALEPIVLSPVTPFISTAGWVLGWVTPVGVSLVSSRANLAVRRYR